MMGFLASSCSGESVIVVMDANRSREKLAALNWALDNVVRPKDTVVVLGILCEVGKKSSCFPFYIWEKLEFSAQGDMTPKVLEVEIMKKREEYQAALQPFYRQCKRNEVKLEVKLAAGFSPKLITIEEAQNTNTRWIVLDSHLKKDRVHIYGHVGCNIAVMKSKNVATIMPSLADDENKSRKQPMGTDQLTTAVQHETPQRGLINATLKVSSTSPPNPCWYPLSWRLGFPQNFTAAEIESITKDFARENILFDEENIQVYKGFLMESPVLVKCFVGTGSDECFWSELKILAKVRHRNILNLVGYCCTDSSMFLLYDFPFNGSLDKHLECRKTNAETNRNQTMFQICTEQQISPLFPQYTLPDLKCCCKSRLKSIQTDWGKVPVSVCKSRKRKMENRLGQMACAKIFPEQNLPNWLCSSFCLF